MSTTKERFKKIKRDLINSGISDDYIRLFLMPFIESELALERKRLAEEMKKILRKRDGTTQSLINALESASTLIETNNK